MNTYLLIIGASNYLDENISDLKSVSNDVIRIHSIFTLLGICEKNTHILQGENATKSKIINFIRRNPYEISSEDSLIIYFAGHGKVITSSGQKKHSILFTYDTLVEDLTDTGIDLDKLIESVYFKMSPKKVSIFIDACEINLTALPEAVLEHIKNNTDSGFSLIAATKGENTFSDGRGGIFTSCLINGLLASIKEQKNQINDLICFLQNEFPVEKEIFHISIGSPIEFCRTIEPSEIKVKSNETKYIIRNDSIISILLYIYSNYNLSELCLYGNTKMGKTILVLEMANIFPNMVYVDIDVPYTFESTKQSIGVKLLDCLRQLNKIPIQGYEYDLENIIEYINSLDKSDYYILLDHSERLKNCDYDQLASMLASCKYIKLVSISRIKRDGVNSMEFPSFSDSEISSLRNMLDINPLHDIEYYKDKPQELIKETNHNSQYNQEGVNECMRSLCLTGGFLDESDFCELMKINKSDLYVLMEDGSIVMRNNMFVPHDSLYEACEIDPATYLVNSVGQNYWINQYILKPHLSVSAIRAFQILSSSGIEVIKDKEKVVRLLTHSFIDLHKWNEVEQLFPILVHLRMVREILLVAEEMASISRDYVFSYDNEIKSIFKESDYNIWSSSYAELLYWKGDFDQSLQISYSLLQNTSLNKLLYSKICLNIAVALFFIGEWENSKKYLEFIVTNKKRLLGWKKMIIGTILAIRGEDFNGGITSLMSSITLLKKSKDDIGLGIAYCNLGECHSKNTNYSIAKRYLDEGEKIVKITNDYATLMEIKRNQLQNSFLKKSSFDSEAQQYMNELINLLSIVSDKTELMQVYSTLSLASLYSYKIRESKQYCKLARQYSVGNKEYEIYSLLCDALISLVESNAVTDDLEKSYQLAYEGDNRLAIFQMWYMIKDLSKLYNLSIPNNQIIGRIEQYYENNNTKQQ